MTAQEALKYKRKGGKLYEPVSQRDLILLDVERHFQSRSAIVVMTTIPATNPGHEHGTSEASYKEALAASRAGRIVQKIIR